MLGQNGSASAPTWSFLNTTNSGMYSSGSNDVRITTGGTLRLTLDSSAAAFTVPVTVSGNNVYYATGTDVPITDGGTGASDAAGARVNLGIGVSVPSTATSTGVAGQIAYDSSWLYICTATDTWRRVAIASW